MPYSRLNLSDLKIMCVDDNKNTHAFLRAMFLAIHIRQAHFFLNVVNAFEMMEVLDPDIVTVDLVLDSADGLDFIRRIRRAQSGRDRG